MSDDIQARQRQARPNYARRIVLLGIFVAVAGAAYTGAWFYFADRLQRATAKTLAEIESEGGTARCDEAAVGGFPFRIGLSCARVAYFDSASGVGVSAGAFRSAGQIYAPSHLVGELDGPARIEAPGVMPLDLDWARLRASVRLAAPLPERLSVEGGGLTVGAEQDAPLASATAFEAHMRTNGPDIDLAASFEDLALNTALVDGRTLPPLTGGADLTLTGGVALAAAADASWRGVSGTVRALDLSDGATAGLNASGPFSIDAEGRLDADMKVVFREPNALSALLSRVFPEHGDRIRMSFSGLALLGSEPWLQLKVVKGRAMLGFIPLGQIPPIR